ncbi:tRNA lysidine(34) synthetase TilS [Ancylobacter sp. TS-1]|uniref:tRNA lysidine(34) synthetase TilS n=1 Tax=Ancylobacter sp. TS-1 TaxID=1850374 RepID=UPI001265CC3C|nr:tRNA lysidine(34) synthetase TilS [Ancylobacter sp. TS-1]QFR33280.1 tRNA lysidine(34) synthetase TilS [Ancylobacter sp. TS-1]
MPAAEAGHDTESGGPDGADPFTPFARHPRVLLAVSGGPDSTALLLLAHRWQQAAGAASELHVATVDHGLRTAARAEAEAVGALAARLGLPHAILTLAAPLPRARLQEAARHARYEALAAHARVLGATAIATAHTLDDQAETVLFRLLRGSGLAGLAGIPGERPLGDIRLIRPLLGWPKAALIEECRRAGVSFAEDPSNTDPRFARTRLRVLLPSLAAEGLDAPALARLAARMARAEAALEAATDAAQARLRPAGPAGEGPIRFPRADFDALPAEIGLRLLGRAVESVGEGPVELGKLEALAGWRAGLGPSGSGARTLAGALVRVDRHAVTVGAAPVRRPARRSR